MKSESISRESLPERQAVAAATQQEVQAGISHTTNEILNTKVCDRRGVSECPEGLAIRRHLQVQGVLDLVQHGNGKRTARSTRTIRGHQSHEWQKSHVSHDE